MGLVALGGILRFATLDAQSYWTDEVVTANLLHQGLGDALSQVPTSESTPPLYYLLAWFWTRAFGLGEVGLRSLSALFGTLTIPAAYLFAARLASVRAGLVTAALVALNPILWWYSQEARAYALLVFLCTIASVAFLEALAGRKRGLTLWALASSLALASHYYAGFLVVTQGAWLVYRSVRADRASLRRTVAACGAVGLVGVAALALARHQVSNGGPQFIDQSGSLGYRVLQVPKQFLVGFDAPAETFATLICALLVAWAVLSVRRGDAADRRGALIAAVLAAGAILLPLVAAALGSDYVLARNLLPGLVPALAVVGIGFASLRTGYLGVLAPAGMCVLWLATIGAVTTTARYQRDDWRAVAEALGPAAVPREIVVTPIDGEGPLRWYLGDAQAIGSVRTVREIDVVALARRRPGKPLRPQRGPAPVPAGSTVAQRLYAPTYTLLRYRADPALAASYESGNSIRIGAPQAFVLYQEPKNP